MWYTSPMISWKFGLALAGFTLAPLAAIASLHAGASFDSADGTRSGVNFEGARKGAILAQITAAYVARGQHVTPAMRSGAQFAPIEFLNERLLLSGHRWQVRSITGLDAETFDIS